MMRASIQLRLATLALLGCLVPGLAMGSNTNAVLGSDGELYSIAQGSYEELFPEGTETDGLNSVLALDVTWPNRDSERLLVPGTKDSAVESAPSLTLERASGTLFVAWESTRTIHSELFIVGRNAEEWSEIQEFSGSPFTTKANPRLAPTHERFRLPTENGEISEGVQTVLHLTWWDEFDGEGRVLYAPLIVTEDGLVRTEAIDLNEWVADDIPAAEAHPNTSFSQTPFIQAGRDENHVVLAFVDSESGRLVTLSARLAGTSIDSLADKARAQVIIFGLQNPSNEELAFDLQDFLKTTGSSYLDDSIAEFLSLKASQAILEDEGGSTIESLAQKARAQVVIFGSRIGGGFSNSSDEARAQVVIFGDHHPGLSYGRSMAVELINHRSVPYALPATAEAQIYVSPDGHDMIVSWIEDDSVHYVESSDEEWTEVRTLLLSGDLTADLARAILQRRIGS